MTGIRVMRGGAWNGLQDLVQCPLRSWFLPNYYWSRFGLRLSRRTP